MLDEVTRDQCAAVERMARQEGLDLYETLDRAGLLLTETRRKMIQQGILSLLLLQLEEQVHTALANIGGGQTVTGAVNGVTKFIEMFTRNLR